MNPREIVDFVIAWADEDEDRKVNGMDERNRARCADALSQAMAPEDVCEFCGIERTRENVTAWCVKRPENEDGPHEWVRP